MENFFVEIGKRNEKVLILLHGNGENLDSFRGQVGALSRHFHLFLIDTRGHGKSERGKAPFTLDQFALDLYHFIEKHELDQVSLLGFSDGANIALLFALAHPERIDKLVLAGANYKVNGIKRPELIGMLGQYVKASVIPSKSNRKKKELLSLMLFEPAIMEKQLRTIQAPALVIAGTDDVIKDHHTQRLAELLENGKLVLLPGDHFHLFSHPAPFNQEVLSFLLEDQDSL